MPDNNETLNNNNYQPSPEEVSLGSYGYADEDDPRQLGYTGPESPSQEGVLKIDRNEQAAIQQAEDYMSEIEAMPRELNPDLTPIEDIISYLRSGKFDDHIRGLGPLPEDDTIIDAPPLSDEDDPSSQPATTSPDGVLSINHDDQPPVEGPKAYRYKASDIEKAADSENQPYSTYLIIHHIDPAEVDPNN